MFKVIGEALWDALVDLRYMVFVLYLSYLLIGYLTHHKAKGYSNLLKKTRKTGPLIGAFLGCVPQCGFSSVMADVYSKKAISLGTLVAVFIATSDEAIPIMFGHPEAYLDILILLGFKLALAIFFGYVVDLIYNLIFIKKKKAKQIAEENIEVVIEKTEEEHNPCDCECHHHEDGHKHKKDKHCCADNIFLDALIHTLKITAIIFVATTIINLLIHYLGLDFITSWLGDNAYLQILICSLIGLIPNCASSVLLVELYLSGGILFSAMLAGLCVGSGVGIFVLFSKNRGKKKIFENISILVLMYAIGVASGIFVNLIY